MFWNKLVIAVELTREVVVVTPAHVHVLFQVVAPPDLDRVLLSNAKRPDPTLPAVVAAALSRAALGFLALDEVARSSRCCFGGMLE